MEYNNISLDFSILNRSMHKFYDLALSDTDLNAGQVTFLTILRENEGISLIDLAKICSFDKGTVSKAIQKLEELNYVYEEIKTDKRSKGIFLTSKAQDILAKLFLIKKKWFDYLSKDIDILELKTFLKVEKILVNRARNYLNINLEKDQIKFYGLQKSTLLDYPGKLASTIFTGGCNFCCSFCHNGDLVFIKEGIKEIAEEDILSFLKERKKILDGVCISGGEPLLQAGLKDFIIKVKELGLLVKLDTNGYYYDKLKELIDLKLIDYVAMDIKNSKEKYAITCGLKELDLTNIEKSITLLKSNVVDYEFRTTIVKEYHDTKDIENIGLWLNGADKYFLQSFKNSNEVINKNLNSHDVVTLNKYKDILSKYIKNVEIRGI